MEHKMEHKIKIVRGTTEPIPIALRKRDGTAYALASGEVVVFGVKKKCEDEACLILKTITSLINGVGEIALTPDDTADLTCGKYVYDVGLKSGANFYNVIPASDFVITENVTKWGDA